MKLENPANQISCIIDIHGKQFKDYAEEINSHKKAAETLTREIKLQALYSLAALTSLGTSTTYAHKAANNATEFNDSALGITSGGLGIVISSLVLFKSFKTLNRKWGERKQALHDAEILTHSLEAADKTQADDDIQITLSKFSAPNPALPNLFDGIMQEEEGINGKNVVAITKTSPQKTPELIL